MYHQDIWCLSLKNNKNNNQDSIFWRHNVNAVNNYLFVVKCVFYCPIVIS